MTTIPRQVCPVLLCPFPYPSSLVGFLHLVHSKKVFELAPVVTVLVRITVAILLFISGISGKCRNLYQANRFCEPYQLVFHRTEVSIILQMEACM